MPLDPDQPNNNQTYNNPYANGGNEKVKLRRLILIVIGVLFVIFILILTAHLSQPESQQSKYTKSATAAAKKHTPNAKVTNVKVAGGFAIATVSDPTSQSQSNAGNTTIFKVNKDGSMVQIANGSYFSPLDLLGLGIPLATQAELTSVDLEQIKQNLAQQCGYSKGLIGYTGFGGSFNPGGWQIDTGTLDILMQKVSNVINAQNVKAMDGKSVICVIATQKNSSFTTDSTTYINTYTLQLQFITGDGTITNHTVTFTNGAPRYRTYSLDGQKI